MSKSIPLRKTVSDCNAQTLLKTARVEAGHLVVVDRCGHEYRARRCAQDDSVILCEHIASGRRVGLHLEDWGRRELAWWEWSIDAHTPAENVFLLLGDDNVVLGILADPELAAFPERCVPVRTNTYAPTRLPEVGEVYNPAPVAAPIRPRRTRGLSRLESAERGHERPPAWLTQSEKRGA